MKLFFLSIAFIFAFTASAFAQIDVPYDVKSVSYTTQKKEPGATVKVYDGANLIQTATTDAAGEVRLTLKAGKIYKIEVSKPGKVMRYVTVNITNVNDELIQGSSKIFGRAQISLFDETPNVDYSYVTSNPITEFKYDGKNNELQYNTDMAAKMAQKIDKILKDAESKKGESDANYSKLVKDAEALYTAKKYKEALPLYEQANLLKPTEKLPNDRIKEIDGILKAEKNAANANAQLDQEYQSLITAANSLRDQKKYEEAKARYQEALTKKQEQYPKDEIAKCDVAIAEAKKNAENKGKYDAAMTAANGFYTQKSWMAARDKYKEALKWLPNDPIATAKLADIETKINAQKAEQDAKKKYQETVDAADALLAADKLQDAKAKYQEAMTMNSAATYPAEKIKIIDEKLAAQAAEKAKIDQINKLLAEGNTAFTANQFPAAKAKYQEVIKLDATNATATGRLTEIETKLAEEKANAEKYARAKTLVTEGDALAKAGKNQEAKAKYTESLSLKVDPAVQTKIDAIDALLASAAQKAEQKAKFDKAIADGDAALATKDFEGAKAKYNEASTLDAASAIPKQKIAEVDKQIAAQNALADKAKKYSEAILAGDAAMASQDYATAKTKFSEAVALDNTKQEAKDKLTAAQAKLTENATALANKAKYDAAIKAGSDLQAAGKLAEARVKYQEAAKILSTETLPVEKIKEIDASIAAAEKEKQLTNLLAEGSTAMSKKDYPTAKAKYNQVLAVDAGNTTASAKLVEISNLENALAGEQEKLNNAKKLKDEGMALFAQGKFPEAKQKFIESKGIVPDASIDAKIVEIDKKIAENAKASEAKAKYDEAMQVASSLQSSGKLVEARAKYVEASTIDPTQSLPKDKIKEIDQAKSAAEKTAQLNQLLSEGNLAFNNKELGTAKAKFQQVLLIDQGNAIATEKLKEIQKFENAEAGEAEKKARFDKLKQEGTALLAQNKLPEAKAKLIEAKGIKEDSSIDALLSEIEKKIAEQASLAAQNQILANYNKVLSDAKNLETAKKYDEAIAKYNEAISIKNEQEPKDRIAAIRDLQLKAASSNSKLDNDYNAALAKGEELIVAKNYPEAIKSFEAARALKPTETLPIERIKVIEGLVVDEQKKENEARYSKILSAAETAFNEKNYTKAREMYNRALTFRADDPIPKQKLAEIDLLEKSEKDGAEKQAQYIKKIGEAEAAAKVGKLENAISLFEQAKSIKPDETLPDNRISELRTQLANVPNPALELEKKYQEAMSEGATAESAKNYSGALASYQQALGLKAKDKAASDKIAEMKQLLDNQAKANKRQAEIDALLSKANASFDAAKWKDAKDKYEEVLAIDGSNIFAIDRVGECQKQLDKMSSDEAEAQYRKLIDIADKNFNNADYKKAKDYYNRAVKNKPSDPYPKRKLKEIDDILNPKPKPPVVVPTPPTGPEPLAALGVPVDNSETDGDKRLAEAATKRKRRTGNAIKTKIDNSANDATTLADKQLLETTASDSTLALIKKENNQTVIDSDEKRQENVLILSDKDKQITDGTNESNKIKTVQAFDQKSQIELTNKTTEEQSAVLDGGAAKNNEVLKEGQNDLVEKQTVIGQDSYGERINNDVNLSTIAIKNDRQVIDDFDERKVVEGVVTDATQKVVDVTAESKKRTDNNIVNVEDKIEDVNQTINDQVIEDKKQSPLNGEEIRQRENQVTILGVEDQNESLNNVLVIKEELLKADRAQLEFSEATDASHNENASIIEKGSMKKDELDRKEYNQTYVKSLENKTSIVNEVITQDKLADLPSIAVAENVTVVDKINTNEQQQANAANSTQNNKRLENQGTLNSTKTVVETKSGEGSQKANNNAEGLKETQQGLGTAELKKGEEQVAKNLESKKSLSAIQNKEPEVVDKAANDLGKLYPEGVSQEQFDQLGTDGLVSAVVTRRVVVKNGHGDLYIRTQTIDGTTYSKNGQATTEATWQRETQDARLKRNF